MLREPSLRTSLGSRARARLSPVLDQRLLTLSVPAAAPPAHNGWQMSPMHVSFTQTAPAEHWELAVQGVGPPGSMTLVWMQAHVPSMVWMQMHVKVGAHSSHVSGPPQAGPQGGSAHAGYCAKAGVRKLDMTGADQARAVPAATRVRAFRREILSRDQPSGFSLAMLHLPTRGRSCRSE